MTTNVIAYTPNGKTEHYETVENAVLVNKARGYRNVLRHVAFNGKVVMYFTDNYTCAGHDVAGNNPADKFFNAKEIAERHYSTHHA